MKEEVLHINDPLGRRISIAKKLCCLENEADAFDLVDDLFSVLKKPALLIETTGFPKEYLYFRSIGWSLSVLIHVRFIHDFWEAYKCNVNPSDAEIVEFLRNGIQII